MACCESCGAKGCDGTDMCGAVSIQSAENTLIPKFVGDHRAFHVSGSHPDIGGTIDHSGAVPSYAGGNSNPAMRKFIGTNSPLNIQEAYTIIQELVKRSGMSAYLPNPTLPITNNTGIWFLPTGFFPLMNGLPMPAMLGGPNDILSMILGGGK